MDFLKIHQVVGNVYEDPELFFIEVERVHTTPEEIEEFDNNIHKDIVATRVRVRKPWDVNDYYMISPAPLSLSKELARKKYGFIPNTFAGDSPADNVIYLPMTPMHIEYFKETFTNIMNQKPPTRPYITKMFRDVDTAIITGRYKLAPDDLEAIINL